jgi:TPR repeat protein
MYDNGWGVTQDSAQAVSWYRKAADAGDADGMYQLGIMYQNVTPDYAQAMSWYRKAADAGNTMARDLLKRRGK